MRALDNVRVIDASEEIAGAYCAKLLADLGADVVKVESMEGDPLRRWTGEGPSGVGPGGLFEYLHTSQRGVVLDLDADADSRRFLEMGASADLVVESAGPRSLSDRGCSFDQLQLRNPALSLVSISPFGLGGDGADVPATEFTLQAYCGSIIRGPDDEPPLHAGGRLGEWATGTFAAMACLAAVRQARRSGRGQHVDLSMLECMALTFNPYPSVLRSFLGTDHPGERKREIPSISRAKDGWIGFCTVTGQQWENFCLLIQRPDLLEDDGLRTWLDRVRRFDEVTEIIEAWSGSRTVAEILEQAEAFRVPAAPIGTGDTICDIDQFRARKVFVRNPRGSFVQPRSPLLLTSSPVRPFGPAPDLGEHTREVLSELDSDPSTPTPAASILAPTPPPEGQAATGPARPLAGLRVIDFTAFWAGPMATQFLGAMGADVVKIESVQRPDAMRYNSVSTPEDPLWYEKSPIFHGANVGKRSVAIDLGDPRGKELVLRLISTADVVIENFNPRVLDRFGLDYENLRKLNPLLVMVRMPAFGLDGPWRDRGGFAQTMEQVSGMGSVTGKEDGPPLIPSGPCDVFAGTHAVVGLLAALHQRDRTGQGQMVEVPMVEVALNVAAEPVIEWSRNRVRLGRHGNRGPVAAPQGLYACAGDGAWLALAIVDNKQWDALVTLLGRPGWAQDPSLVTVAGRRQAHDLIDGHLKAYLGQQDLDLIVPVLQQAGIPSAPVVPAGYIDRDPRMRNRNFFEPVDHPLMGRHELPGWPMRSSSWPDHWYVRPAPQLGEHTVDVLTGDLALTAEDIAILWDDHVIGTTPLGL
ncbi:MAG TPA: CoA transferase [Acidimicrobiales bacterium]|jgi:crotonobetainyl-CoA:carnitine CoA-transferase CaiB-like acyl-CoA transferase|nr:CoA transferase [Acidimicrobiales bacterium]